MSDSNELRFRAEESGANLYGPLLEGLTTLSGSQRIRFNQYVRVVLPMDGYVYWFKSGEFHVTGSLHIDASRYQNEDETITINRVVFQSPREIAELNAIAPGNLVVGSYGNLRFALDRQGYFFEQAKIWHYEGQAVYPALLTQLVDDPAQIDTANQVVSNSLPAWLALATYNPIWLTSGNPGITLYPSFLVPNNLAPPYGAVHIMPDSVQPLQLVPLLSSGSTHSVLTRERVRVTLYGCDNATATSFHDLVIQYSRDTSNFGMVAPAAIVDEKRTQPALTVLAQKKILQFDVSYNQYQMRNVARQLILKVIETFTPIVPTTISYPPLTLPLTPEPFASVAVTVTGET